MESCFSLFFQRLPYQFSLMFRVVGDYNDQCSDNKESGGSNFWLHKGEDFEFLPSSPQKLAKATFSVTKSFVKFC